MLDARTHGRLAAIGAADRRGPKNKKPRAVSRQSACSRTGCTVSAFRK
jgi:hypothetical protein